MSQSVKSQMLIGIVSGVVATVLGGWLLIWFTSPRVDVDKPVKPAITVISQQMKVPAQPIPYVVRQRANPEPKNEDLERLFDQYAIGFRIVQYDIINDTEGLLRDLEVKAPDSDLLYQDSRSEITRVRLDNLKFDLPPNQKLSLISIQKYPDTNLSVSIGTDYYTAVDFADYAAQVASGKAVGDISRYNYLLDKTLVRSLGIPLFGLCLAFAPLFLRRKPNPVEPSPEPVETEGLMIGEGSQSIATITQPNVRRRRKDA